MMQHIMMQHIAATLSSLAQSGLGGLWCRLMHDDITWPIHGHYRCQRCHRLYPVPWKEQLHQPPPAAWQGMAA